MKIIAEQMNAAKSVIADGLTILDDVIFGAVDSFLCKATSDRAMEMYRAGWAIAKQSAKAAWWVIGLMMAAAFFSGVLARRVWEWLNDYVAQCEVAEVEPVEVKLEAIAEDSTEVVVALPVVEDVAPVVEDVQPQPVKRKIGSRKARKASQAA